MRSLKWSDRYFNATCMNVYNGDILIGCVDGVCIVQV